MFPAVDVEVLQRLSGDFSRKLSGEKFPCKIINLRLYSPRQQIMGTPTPTIARRTHRQSFPLIMRVIRAQYAAYSQELRGQFRALLPRAETDRAMLGDVGHSSCLRCPRLRANRGAKSRELVTREIDRRIRRKVVLRRAQGAARRKYAAALKEMRGLLAGARRGAASRARTARHSYNPSTLFHRSPPATRMARESGSAWAPFSPSTPMLSILCLPHLAFATAARRNPTAAGGRVQCPSMSATCQRRTGRGAGIIATSKKPHSTVSTKPESSANLLRSIREGSDGEERRT